jgi:hypothetical protein
MYFAIVIYRPEVAGELGDSVDIQVQYFDEKDPAIVEARILNEPPLRGQNEAGQAIVWNLDEIVQIEEVDVLEDGAEVIGFIRDQDGFGIDA